MVFRLEIIQESLCGVAVGAVGFGEDDYSTPQLAIYHFNQPQPNTIKSKGKKTYQRHSPESSSGP